MTVESGRPRMTVTAVLLATIGGVAYVLAPLARKRGRAGGAETEELRNSVEELHDRLDDLTDQVTSMERRLKRSGWWRRDSG